VLYNKKKMGQLVLIGSLGLSLLLLVAQTSLTSGWLASNPYGSVTKTTPKLEASEGFNLTCHVNPGSGHTASDVYFTLDDDIIDEGYTYVADNQTALLRHTDGLEMEDDQKWICCWLKSPSQKKEVGCWVVWVGLHPYQPIIDESSIMVENWQSLEFTWTKRENKHYETEEVGQYKLGKGDWEDCSCIGRTQCCHVSGDRFKNIDMDLSMRVVTSNLLGEVQSKVVQRQIRDIVRPGGVKLKYLEVESDGKKPDVAIVKWRSPLRNKQRELHYQMILNNCDRDQPEEEVKEKTSSEVEVTIEIPNHAPNQQCTLTVRCKEMEGGIWSQNTTIDFTMPQMVPDKQPAIAKGGFLLNVNARNGTLDATLFWKPINEHDINGNNLHYMIRYEDPQTEKIVEIPGDRAAPQLRGLSPVHTYTVYITAHNDKGTNKNVRAGIITIAHQKIVPPVPANITAIADDDRHVTVSWQQYREAVTYTVYWCRYQTIKGNRQCKDPHSLNWTSVFSTENSARLALTDCTIHECMFGLSVETMDGSSGIHWTCVYNRNEVSPAPELGLVVASHKDIYMSLHQPLCSSLHGYVYGYRITWCPLDKAFNICSAAESSVMIPPDEEYTLRPLDYLQRYKIEVTSITVAGISKTSAMEIVETKKPLVTPDELKYYIPMGVAGIILVILGIATFVKRCICPAVASAKKKANVEIDDFERVKIPLNDLIYRGDSASVFADYIDNVNRLPDAASYHGSSDFQYMIGRGAARYDGQPSWAHPPRLGKETLNEEDVPAVEMSVIKSQDCRVIMNPHANDGEHGGDSLLNAESYVPKLLGSTDEQYNSDYDNEDNGDVVTMETTDDYSAVGYRNASQDDVTDTGYDQLPSTDMTSVNVHDSEVTDVTDYAPSSDDEDSDDEASVTITLINPDFVEERCVEPAVLADKDTISDIITHHSGHLTQLQYRRTDSGFEGSDEQVKDSDNTNDDSGWSSKNDSKESVDSSQSESSDPWVLGKHARSGLRYDSGCHSGEFSESPTTTPTKF
jgi:hypothetical protein